MGTTNQTGNDIGIFEQGDFYDQADLDQTFASIAPYVPQVCICQVHIPTSSQLVSFEQQNFMKMSLQQEVASELMDSI